MTRNPSRNSPQALSGRKLDIVINNAGILTRESLDDLDWDRIRTQFEINALGPLRVTKPRCCPASRKARRSPSFPAGSAPWPTTHQAGNYGYRMSKSGGEHGRREPVA